MEHETFAVRDRSGDVLRYVCGVDPGEGNQVFTGCGPTEEAAKLDAFAKAAEEHDEARIELGILLGQRGGTQGGRRPGGIHGS